MRSFCNAKTSHIFRQKLGYAMINNALNNCPGQHMSEVMIFLWVFYRHYAVFYDISEKKF